MWVCLLVVLLVLGFMVVLLVVIILGFRCVEFGLLRFALLV